MLDPRFDVLSKYLPDNVLVPNDQTGLLSNDDFDCLLDALSDMDTDYNLLTVEQDEDQNITWFLPSEVLAIFS